MSDSKIPVLRKLRHKPRMTFSLQQSVAVATSPIEESSRNVLVSETGVNRLNVNFLIEL